MYLTFHKTKNKAICHHCSFEKEILIKLEECKKYIANEVVKLIDLKFSPKLIFRNDVTIDQVHRIDQILNSEKVLLDTQKK